MKARIRSLVTGVLAVALMAAGCGRLNNNTLTTEERDLANTATDAAGMAESIVDIAAEQVVDAGSGDAASAAKGAKALGKEAGQIDYQETVVITDLDLNTVNANFTGTVTITATGSVTDNLDGTGNVSYSVDVQRTSQVVYTNPVNGTVVTAEAGQGVTFDLSIDWASTDDQNWSIVYEAIAARPPIDLVVDKDADTYFVSVDAQRNETVTIAAVEGVLSIEYQLSGYREVSWTSSEGSHTVRWDVVSLQEITLTIDDVVYGPHTAFEWWLLYQLTVE